MHTGATWRIPLNCPGAVVMRPFCQISLNTCYNFVCFVTNHFSGPDQLVQCVYVPRKQLLNKVSFDLEIWFGTLVHLHTI